MKRITILSLPVVLLFASAAHANDPAAAEALFRDGRSLAASGNWADACAKLEESERLDPGIGTLYHLADCHEHLGKIATAWAELIDVTAQARSHGQKDREQAARKRSDALASRLPHMVLEGAPPRGAEVKRDATVVGAAELGASIPVDPGSHKISVKMPGHVAWETTVTANEAGTVRVKLPAALTAVPVASAPPSPPPAAAPVAATPASTTPLVSPSQPAEIPVQTEPNHVQRNAGIVIAGAGLVSIGIGSYFGIKSIDDRNQSRSHCDGNLCDASGVSLRSDALSSGNVSTVTFIAGAAAVVGGGILFFTAPSTQEARPTTGNAAGVRVVSASPYAGPTGGGLSLTGEFR